jgi:hypothetical protein
MQSELQKFINTLIEGGVSQDQINVFTTLYYEVAKLKLEVDDVDQYDQDGPLYVTIKIK